MNKSKGFVTLSYILERVSRIGNKDASMVIANYPEGFKIGYMGTVWAEQVQETQAFVGIVNHKTDPEFLVTTLKTARRTDRSFEQRTKKRVAK